MLEPNFREQNEHVSLFFNFFLTKTPKTVLGQQHMIINAKVNKRSMHKQIMKCI